MTRWFHYSLVIVQNTSKTKKTSITDSVVNNHINPSVHAQQGLQ